MRSHTNNGKTLLSQSGRDGGGVNKLGLKLIFWLTFFSFNLLTGAESPVSEKRERISNVEYNETLKYKTTFLRKLPFCPLNGVRIAALNEAGALAYYLTDQVDSVSTVLDDEGNTLSLMQYLPYGETFVQRGDLNFSPKFNSQELDRESGFYFFNARFYDPGIARFTSADTVIDGKSDTQGWNRFSYVKGNPIGAKDPTGHYSAEKFTSKPIEAAASKSGPQITGKATGILGRAVGILGLLFATSDLDAPGKDYPSKGTPPRNTSVTPEDAKKMRKQGLDPLNEKDINGSKSSGVSNKGNNTGNGSGKSASQNSINTDKRFSKEKQALVEMAKKDKEKGITKDDMKAYKDLNKELSDPSPTNKVRGPEKHEGRNYKGLHGHVGPVDHIPVKDH